MNIHNKLLKPIAIIALLIYTVNISATEKCAIIASSNIKTEELSKNELSNIFLGKTTILKDWTRIKIAYSTKNAEKMNYFFSEYVGKSQRRFKKYWLKKVFAGYGVAPKIFKNTKNAIDYTKNKDSIITFITIDDKASPEGVSIISVGNNICF